MRGGPPHWRRLGAGRVCRDWSRPTRLTEAGNAKPAVQQRVSKRERRDSNPRPPA